MDKERAIKTKVICLSRMGKNPMMNTSTFTTFEKKKLLTMMENVIQEPDLDKEFNDIICLDVMEKDYLGYLVKE